MELGTEILISPIIEILSFVGPLVPFSCNVLLPFSGFRPCLAGEVRRLSDPFLSVAAGFFYANPAVVIKGT